MYLHASSDECCVLTNIKYLRVVTHRIHWPPVYYSRAQRARTITGTVDYACRSHEDINYKFLHLSAE